jgi:hypothetical protein
VHLTAHPPAALTGVLANGSNVIRVEVGVQGGQALSPTPPVCLVFDHRDLGRLGGPAVLPAELMGETGMESPGNEHLFPRTPHGHRVIFGCDEIVSIPRKPELSGECPPDPKWAAQRGGQDSPITPVTRSRKLMRDGEAHRRLCVPADPVFTARAIRETTPRMTCLTHRTMDEMGDGHDVDPIRPRGGGGVPTRAAAPSRNSGPSRPPDASGPAVRRAVSPRGPRQAVTFPAGGRPSLCPPIIRPV